MSIAYPLFLLAGLTLAIPILIHLFNLRRYKTVFFPNTRFLKNVQINSQKQSQIRYKWLLALRILFLISLILAFAQPFFPGAKKTDTNKLQIIYLDNSSSMSLKQGARNLFDIAKDAVRQQLRQAAPAAQFVLLTNDRPLSYQPMSAEKAMGLLNDLNISTNAKPAAQIFATIQGLLQSEAATGADVYYYSDFQENAFPPNKDNLPIQGLDFFGIPVRAGSVRNLFIDTAFLTSPVVQTGQNNQIVIKSKLVGKTPDEAPVVQLAIDGQVKTALSVDFDEKNESTDTLSFQVNEAEWQRISLSISDAAVRFDDTFRISARSATNLSVLVLNQQGPNPYIQAAARAYPGFRMDQRGITEHTDWSKYNLVVINGIVDLDEVQATKIMTALQQGQSICIFPGMTRDIAGLNEGLSRVGDIRITGFDTASQMVSALQQGSDLARDLFDRIPDNVQLPLSRWHYNIQAGLSANQQAVMSFRNGDPFFAQYRPYRGKLYLLASAADLEAGNFPGSYFFVPFLYQMTAQARGSDVFAVTAGKAQPVFLSLTNADDRNIVHVYADGTDIIPVQRPAGSGLEVYLGQAIQQPGFYNLAAAGSDTTTIAVNQERNESYLRLWDLNELKKGWDGAQVKWLTLSSATAKNTAGGVSSFPLWKLCVILALLMLAAESYLLAAGYKKQTVPSR